jgi:hypothetical protein
MGYRCRWIAVRASERAEALSELQFSVTQELGEAVHDTGLYAVAIADWFVVIGDGRDFMDLVERRQAERLSVRDEVLFFYTDDSEMYAELTCYRSGETSWSVFYDGSDGIAEPTIDGPVPDRAQSIIAAALDEQKAAGEDAADYIYDAVAEIGRTLAGFRHDQTLGDGEHLPIYQLEAPSSRTLQPAAAARSAPTLDAALAAARRVLGDRTIEAMVNEAGVVELYLVVHAVTTPHGPDEIALDRIRAKGLEADEGDELLFPFYYLPDDAGMAADQRHTGLAALLDIPPGAFDAMQRELARPAS